MGEYIDIHRYGKVLERLENSLKLVISGNGSSTSWPNLSRRNAQLILDYENNCALLESVRVPTRIKYIDKLVHFATDFLKLDYDAATKADLKSAILSLDTATVKGKRRYTAHSRHTFRATIKKFYRWIAYGDEYISYEKRRTPPPIVSWLNTQLNAKEYNKIKASDILTEDDVLLLINTTDRARDKAYITMLYELGARIGEHGSLRIRHLSKSEHGYVVDLSGKTGDRTPALILAAPYLDAWLNIHPVRDDPDSPLWPRSNSEPPLEPMYYQDLTNIVRRAAARAGITKRVYNHIFRHSRSTHVLVHGIMNETQAKLYFGWTPDSDMLNEYAHLRMIDVNRSYLASYGLGKEEEIKNKLMPRVCSRCKHINPIDSITCENCRALLDVSIMHEVHETRNTFDDAADVVFNHPAVAQVIREHRSELKRLVSHHRLVKKKEASEARSECATNKVSPDQDETRPA